MKREKSLRNALPAVVAGQDQRRDSSRATLVTGNSSGVARTTRRADAALYVGKLGPIGEFFGAGIVAVITPKRLNACKNVRRTPSEGERKPMSTTKVRHEIAALRHALNQFQDCPVQPRAALVESVARHRTCKTFAGMSKPTPAWKSKAIPTCCATPRRWMKIEGVSAWIVANFLGCRPEVLPALRHAGPAQPLSGDRR